MVLVCGNISVFSGVVIDVSCGDSRIPLKHRYALDDSLLFFVTNPSRAPVARLSSAEIRSVARAWTAPPSASPRSSGFVCPASRTVRSFGSPPRASSRDAPRTRRAPRPRTGPCSRSTPFFIPNSLTAVRWTAGEMDGRVRGSRVDGGASVTRSAEGATLPARTRPRTNAKAFLARLEMKRSSGGLELTTK